MRRGVAGIAGFGCALLGQATLAPSSIADFPNFTHPYSWNGQGCSGSLVDPVTVKFRGDNADPGNVADQVVIHAEWDNTDGSDQWLKVNKEAEQGYECNKQNHQRANHPGTPNSRFHVRIWGVPEGDPLSAGTPHHEDWVWSCPGHAVDSNGPAGSGFDVGRRVLREEFQDEGHHTETNNWGNTQSFQQCDGDWAGSDGIGALISIGHSA